MILWLVGLLFALWLLVAPFLGLWNLLRLRELERRVVRLEGELARLRTTPAAEEARSPAPSAAAPAPSGTGAATPVPRGRSPVPVVFAPRPTPPPPPAQEAGAESRLAARWLALAGGVALALAGLFAVSLAVERGLFGPAAWLSLLALAGTAAFALALHLAARDGGPVPRLLAAAALVTVYADLFAATRLYGLVEPRLALALALLAVGAAIAATSRLGPALLPLAALGAWAAPVLVGVGAMPPLALAGWLTLVQLVFGSLARAWESRLVAWLLPVAALAWVGAAAAGAFAEALAGLRLPDEPAALPALVAEIARELLAVGGLRAADALLPFAALASRPDLPALWRAPTEAPRSLALPLHLHQLFALFALVAGWLVRGGDAPAFAAALLFTVAGLAAASRGGGMAAAAIAGLLPVALVFAAPVPAALPAEVAPGLTAPLPPGVRTLLLQPALLALLAALWGEWRAWSGQGPRAAGALAAAVPLLVLWALWMRLAHVLGGLPFALAALGLAALFLGLTAAAQARARTALAGIHALATVAAITLGALVHFARGDWPVALAAIAFAAVVVHARLPLRGLAAASVALALASSFAAAAELLAGEAAGTLDHALRAGLLPLLVLVLLSRTGLLRAGALSAETVDFARDLTGLVLLAQLVVVMNGLGSSAVDHPVLRHGLLLSAMLRLALALAGLHGAMPAGVRGLWALPLVPAALAAVTLATGHAAPLLHPLDVGLLPVFDALLPGGLVAAGLAAALTLRLRAVSPQAARATGAVALAWLLGWEVLEIRHLARGALLIGPWSQMEHLAVSLCWLATAGVLFAGGLQRDVRELRVAGVAVAALVAVKLFLVDLRELAGLYRVAALFLVGAGLLAFGWFERRRG